MPKSKPGRNKTETPKRRFTEITPERFRVLKETCRLNPTLKDCAVILDCDESTLKKYIKRHFDLTWVEFCDMHMAHTRVDLTRKAIEMAMGGNTAMMIFCLKNLCKWVDKFENKTTIATDIESMTDEELKGLIKDAVSE